MRRSQSLPLPPRIRPLSATICDTTLPTIKYPPFLTTVLYATLPESTPPSQNIPFLPLLQLYAMFHESTLSY